MRDPADRDQIDAGFRDRRHGDGRTAGQRQHLHHGARLAAMPPKLLNDEGDLMVLRPLSYCAEADLAKFADAMRFPIIPCDLCGSQDGLQRNAMKEMIGEMERRMPGRKEAMIRALANVRPSHLLDAKLFDFAGL